MLGQARTEIVNRHGTASGPGAPSIARAAELITAVPGRTALTVACAAPSWSRPVGPTAATPLSELASGVH